MGAWTDSVEARARILHGQAAAARALASRNRADPDEFARPYLDLLSRLYGEEFPFAQLVDSSDLVARFAGPAVSQGSPPVSIVTFVFTNLRKQIQGIAKSIVGLTSDERVRWPAGLDPRLSGVARGSLVVGIRIQPDGVDAVSGQHLLPEVSEPVLRAVRDAVRSVAIVAQYVEGDGVDEEAIEEGFPDPAVRDTVMVAASRLAPTGRRGIDSLAFYGPDDSGMEARPLTVGSRRILNAAVARPVRAGGRGSFVGVVREIDLDARRFEIRHVEAVGAIRCVYGPHMEKQARQMLDKRVRVEGQYEALPNRKPRLIEVSSVDVLVEEKREKQTSLL